MFTLRFPEEKAVNHSSEPRSLLYYCFYQITALCQYRLLLRNNSFDFFSTFFRYIRYLLDCIAFFIHIKDYFCLYFCSADGFSSFQYSLTQITHGSNILAYPIF